MSATLGWVQVGKLTPQECQRLVSLYETEALAHGQLARAYEECGRDSDARTSMTIAGQCALAAAVLRERVES